MMARVKQVAFLSLMMALSTGCTCRREEATKSHNKSATKKTVSVPALTISELIVRVRALDKSLEPLFPPHAWTHSFRRCLEKKTSIRFSPATESKTNHASQDYRVERLTVDLQAAMAGDETKKVLIVGVQAEGVHDRDAYAEELIKLSRITPVPIERDVDALAMKQVNAIWEEACAEVAYQAELLVIDESKLLERLKNEKGEKLATVIEIAALRKLKRCVGPLIELLNHPEEEISDRAIGALVAIGDRQAVKALTGKVDLNDTETLAKIIDGVAALGGEEADDYLEFLAQGHDDEDIRNLAREALERSGIKK